jgi:Gluconate 2-dehydrogenase subunit 3
METVNLSRRSLLQTIAGIVATAITPLSWTDVAHAMDAASAAGQAGAGAKLSFLTAAEAADIDAVTAQIVPTDDSPGAREAGVVYFIDRALATFYSQLAGDYRAQLVSFQATFRERHPSVRSRRSRRRNKSSICRESTRHRSSRRRGCSRCSACLRCLSTAAIPTALAGGSSGSKTAMSFVRRLATTTATIPASSSTL